jgi:hypothetical protein
MQYNTAILVDKTGSMSASTARSMCRVTSSEPWRQFQHLEKRYFTPGKSFDVYQTLAAPWAWRCAATAAGPRPTV